MILIDTCVLLWMSENPVVLSTRVADLIERAGGDHTRA